MAPGIRAASSRWRAGGSTWSLVVTTTAVGTSMDDSHGVEWWRPRDATAWPTAHGLVERHWFIAQRAVSDVSASSASTAAELARLTTRDRDSVAVRPIPSSMPAWKTRSRPLVRKWSVVAARMSPPTASGCWRHTRCATTDPIE